MITTINQHGWFHRLRNLIAAMEIFNTTPCYNGLSCPYLYFSPATKFWNTLESEGSTLAKLILIYRKNTIHSATSAAAVEGTPSTVTMLVCMPHGMNRDLHVTQIYLTNRPPKSDQEFFRRLRKTYQQERSLLYRLLSPLQATGFRYARFYGCGVTTLVATEALDVVPDENNVDYVYAPRSRTGVWALLFRPHVCVLGRTASSGARSEDLLVYSSLSEGPARMGFEWLFSEADCQAFF